MKRGLTLALAAIACLLVPAWAGAQEAVRTETVVVTAGRVEEDQKRVTTAMTVISREEIEKKQYQDMGALLRHHGLQVNAYPPGGTVSQISIRGMRSSLLGDDTDGNVLLLVNGRRTGTDNISLIPLVNVERIEIIRGPAAVQYGTSAAGGVVNVITKRGDQLSAMAEVGTGSWNSQRAQAEISGSTHGFDVSGGVDWLTQGNDYDTGRGRGYDNTDLNYNLAYSLNLGYTFMDEHRIGLNWQGVTSDDSGSPGATYGLTPLDRIDRSNQAVDVLYTGGSEDLGLSWQARYYTGTNKYRIDYGDIGWGAGWMTNETDFQGAQGQVSYAKGFLTLTGGVDWVDYDGEMDSTYMPKAADTTHENLGAFALAKIGILDDLFVLSGGLRYDDYTLKVDGQSDGYSRTTPSVGVAVNPFEWMTLRANYGESFRIPQPVAVLGFYDGMTNYLGNPDLDPEKGKTWDVGAEFRHGSLHAEVTYFQTRYEDKIAAVSVPGWNKQYQNLPGTSKIHGLELEAGYDLGELFEWPFMLRPYVNLTRLFKYEGPDGAHLLDISSTSISYGLLFNHADLGLEVDFRLIYFGKQHVENFDYTSPNYGNIERTGGDTTADLYITKTIGNWENGGRLSLRGEVRNLFDTYYETIQFYPMPGRSFYVGLRYDF